ncbi:MAG: hypothetical protein LQ345_003800, partial [Seirophora villosa]
GQDDDSSDLKLDWDGISSTLSDSEESVLDTKYCAEDAAEATSSEYMPDGSDVDESYMGKRRKRDSE